MLVLSRMPQPLDHDAYASKSKACQAHKYLLVSNETLTNVQFEEWGNPANEVEPSQRARLILAFCEHECIDHDTVSTNSVASCWL